jgi:hypothetical protein
MIPSSEVFRLPRACSSKSHFISHSSHRRRPNRTARQLTPQRACDAVSAFVADVDLLLEDCIAKSSRISKGSGLCPSGSVSSGNTYIDIANGNSAGHFCGIVGNGREGGGWVMGCRSVRVGELDSWCCNSTSNWGNFFRVGFVALGCGVRKRV